MSDENGRLVGAPCIQSTRYNPRSPPLTSASLMVIVPFPAPTQIVEPVTFASGLAKAGISNTSSILTVELNVHPVT